MSFFNPHSETGRADELWPVLLLLLTVAIPTVSVLWFVGVAVDNQRLAAKQRLTEAYRSNLSSLQSGIQAEFDELLQRVDRIERLEQRPAKRFLDTLDATKADSIICLDSKGNCVYPDMTDVPPAVAPTNAKWLAAARTENQEGNLRVAHGLYEKLAQEATTTRLQALALQAQVRCLRKLNETDAATELVFATLQHHQFESIDDPVANSVLANIELTGIESTSSNAAFSALWDRLERRLLAADSTIRSSQRLFLLRRMAEIDPDRVNTRRLAAEAIAAKYVSSVRLDQSPPLRQLPDEDLWSHPSDTGNTILILSTVSLRQIWRNAAAKLSLPQGTLVELLSPADSRQPDTESVSLAMGASFPGWEMRLSHSEDNKAHGVQHVSIHVWTGALVVLFTSIFGVAITRAFQRNLRLANLKNDLVGTVSHELKTPLASIRLLVDTLLAEEQFEASTTREYLQLIDKENVRLTRLIENFLTFSRMDQQRHQFEFQEVQLDEAIQDAIDSLGDRLSGPGCELDVEIPQELPSLWADKDGLVTVFLNLLDNAYKYSEGTRKISVRASSKPQSIEVTISDNGIGLPRSASRRIFERFFQVDQSLVREGRGCGLGLSIVEFIVHAHNGSIEVTSQLGKGSDFTVTLPINANRGSANGIS